MTIDHCACTSGALVICLGDMYIYYSVTKEVRVDMYTVYGALVAVSFIKYLLFRVIFEGNKGRIRVSHVRGSFGPLSA
jgi:hypothetical protein